ncbi:hypothetical protein GOV03_03450 [Candidatus Woesearchaeota archaeon]|nr:hypothetical protein [Candidatus Woesearchaeota archaeon]
MILNPWFIPAMLIVGLWGAAWKLVALWKCGRNNQLAWFVVLAILNTAGILPILYIFFFQKKAVKKVAKKKPAKRKKR